METAPVAVVESTAAAATEAPLTQAASPPPETRTVEADHRMLVEAAPLVVDFNPLVPGGAEASVDAFQTTIRSGAGTGDLAFPTPSSSVVETAKDKAISAVTASLPGPRQSILVSSSPYSGPVPARPDASGKFPLAELAERVAQENLSNIALLRSSLEQGFAEAAKEATLLKRELEAARGLVSFLVRFLRLVILHSFLHVLA